MTAGTSESPAGSVEIRPATVGDLAGIHDLALRVLPPTYVSTGLLSAEEVRRMIDAFWSPEYFSSVLHENALLWIAENYGSVVGVAEVARLGEAEAVLWKLYIDRELQRRGLGAQLLEAVGASLWSGTERWFTEYVTGNQTAAAFYAKHGFEFDRVEPDERPDVDATYTWCVRDAAAPIGLR